MFQTQAGKAEHAPRTVLAAVLLVRQRQQPLRSSPTRPPLVLHSPQNPPPSPFTLASSSSLAEWWKRMRSPKLRSDPDPGQVYASPETAMAVDHIDLTGDASSDSESGSEEESTDFNHHPPTTSLAPSLATSLPTSLEGRSLPVRIASQSPNTRDSPTRSRHSAGRGVSRGPISPPPLKRSAANIRGQAGFPLSQSVPVQPSEASKVPESVPAPALPASPVATTQHTPEMPSPASTDGRGNMSPLKATPSATSNLTDVRQIYNTTTPIKANWDVPMIVQSLVQLRRDVEDGHSRLAAYIIDSTDTPERRVRSGADLFANINSKPVAQEKNLTVRIKFKQHIKNKRDQKEEHHRVLCTETNEERVPRYRFHHVEIKKNILTPTTMMTFVPHLRDLENSEELRYNLWLKELEDIDQKTGFKTMSREEKVAVTVGAEYAATISLYLEDWLEKLSIPGCNKSALIRYMANEEPDNAITPKQKSDILSSHQETSNLASPETHEIAGKFTEAFHAVFQERQTAAKKIELRQVLLLDEAVDTIMDPRSIAKDAPSPQGDMEGFVKEELSTYCDLGCNICYSHSCEHGYYDKYFLKQAAHLLPDMAKFLRLRTNARKDTPYLADGDTQASVPCHRQCHQIATSLQDDTTEKPWSKAEFTILRSIHMAATDSKVTKSSICLVADLLDRDCCDVFRHFQQLEMYLPQPEPVKKVQVKSLSWYDRHKKALLGDWKDQTESHEHQRLKDIPEPCCHEGPCTQGKCSCVDNNLLCEKSCACTVDNCAHKFTGCACHSQGKTCLTKQRDRPCICVQLNRECDPALCGTCGSFERADPENADDKNLQATGCQNCVLQRGTTKALVLGKSQLEGVGYGLFTAQDIAQDEFVIEYVGELVSHDEGVRREARRGEDVFDDASAVSYLFTLLEREGTWVDAAIYGNLSRYINHASESDNRGCNITPKIMYVNGEYRIKFSAMRHIDAGEEIFFNYGANFPNLTKTLIDDRVGGKSRGPKKRGRRPNKPGVARKTTQAAKKKPPRKANAARKEARPDPVTENAAIEDWPTTPTRHDSSRKRKRGSLDDSEEEEYQPTEGDAAGSREETPSTIDSDEPFSQSLDRLRRRTRHGTKGQTSEGASKPRGQPKTRGKRGGARPGSGRPRKHPRPARKPVLVPDEPTTAASKPAEQEEMETPTKSKTTAVREPPEADMDEIDDSQETIDYSMSLYQAAFDEEDQDVVVRKRMDRGRRNRRPPAKFRDDDRWMLDS
ncbi:hypothetical protein G7046_g3244 [Stylonectria norvegica]|nr:hypothetical protein G7046_g3244 [Stylonectria norvegica]